MNLLLTSAGLTHTQIKECFIEEIKKLSNQKIAVLYTIKNVGDEQWLRYREAELGDLGFEYDFINISQDSDLLDKLGEYGVIYVCGGNTFYILDRLRKTKVIDYIENNLDKNIFYAGISAGSMVMSPYIKIASVGAKGDDNDVNLEDLSGFNLVPFSIYPHYEKSDKGFIEQFFMFTKKPLIALNDRQAIFVSNENFKIIGDSGGFKLGLN
jgi:dipeptidase E